MERDFFKLEGSCPDFDELAFMHLVSGGAARCENRVYRPDMLTSPYAAGRLRVKKIAFRNVSFARTVITGLEFSDCTFERCLFISTTFRNCRFTSCSFEDCNPFRAEFDACYLNPASFEKCIPSQQYANIGVYLFQELLRNSRQQAQPDFSDEAQYRFRKWQRDQLKQELKGLGDRSFKRRVWWHLLGLHIFECVGSGVRVGKLLKSALLGLSVLTLVNWLLASQLGLKDGGKVIVSVVDAFYFATVVTTTLGFGDIVPTTWFGRIVVSFEAISGFVLFALVTSTLYRKFSS